MKTTKFLNFLSIPFLAFILAACGGGDGGGAPTMNLGATALKSGQAVAAAPKSKAMDQMWALVFGKEAIAAHDVTCDPNKEFLLSGGVAKVCLKTAYIVLDEIEMEKDDDDSTPEMEIELGPFVLDLLGNPDDGIPGSVTISVLDGAFNKIKLKVDDLDDDDNDGLNSNDDGISDDVPENVTPAAAAAAGLVKKSLVITGSATDGAGGHKDFSFSTNIEGKIKIPFTNSVLDESNLIALYDLTPGFDGLSYAQIDPDMFADMSSSGSGSEPSCANPQLTPAQKLACAVVKNIDLFEDVDRDGDGDEMEGSNDDLTTGFDDSGLSD